MLLKPKRFDQWQRGGVRDVHQEMMRLTLEIIARMLFGRELDDEIEEAAAAINVYLEQFANRFGLYAVPERIPTPGNLRCRRPMQRLEGFIYDAIHEGRRAGGDGTSLLTAFLRARQVYGVEMTNLRGASTIPTNSGLRGGADGLAERLPKFAYFPFVGGPRICVGKEFAQLQTALVLATIMRRFRFRTVSGHRTWPLRSLTLRPE